MAHARTSASPTPATACGRFFGSLGRPVRLAVGWCTAGTEQNLRGVASETMRRATTRRSGPVAPLEVGLAKKPRRARGTLESFSHPARVGLTNIKQKTEMRTGNEGAAMDCSGMGLARQFHGWNEKLKNGEGGAGRVASRDEPSFPVRIPILCSIFGGAPAAGGRAAHQSLSVMPSRAPNTVVPEPPARARSWARVMIESTTLSECMGSWW